MGVLNALQMPIQILSKLLVSAMSQPISIIMNLILVNLVLKTLFPVQIEINANALRVFIYIKEDAF